MNALLGRTTATGMLTATIRSVEFVANVDRDGLARVVPVQTSTNARSCQASVISSQTLCVEIQREAFCATVLLATANFPVLKTVVT